MNGNELFKAYRFDEAVIAYRNQLEHDESDGWANMGGLAEALVASGNYAEAIPYLEKVGAHEAGRLPGGAGREMQLSVCNWLSGKREHAITIMRGAVDGVRDGTIKYADLARGVSQGIILAYMGATLPDTEELNVAIGYLEDRAEYSAMKYWPGPAGLVLLDRMDFDAALRDGTGATSLGQAKKIGEFALLKRRHLTNLLFAAAVKGRISRDEVICRKYMRECASLTNPLIEYEWHLARDEISK